MLIINIFILNMNYTIYLRTNKINGKQYVGQSGVFKRREAQWRDLTTNYANNQLTEDREKYGLENFDVEILADVDTQEESWELEKKYILEYNTLHPNGYNVSTGGGRGFTYQEERNKKISEATKGENNYWYGKKFSDEHRKKISEGNKGKKRSEEFKKHMSEISRGERNHSFGTKHTDEWKKHMSEIMTGRKMPKESIEKTAKAKWKAVIQIKPNGEKVRYECLNQVKDFGYDRSSVSECCEKKYLREGNNIYKKSKWYWEKDYEKMLEEQLNL